MLTAALDTLLDRTVVPGYSKIGYAVRRRFWAADLAPDALQGQVVAITGANSGLGMATALGAARLGAQVRMLCRDTARGEQARAELAAAVPGAGLTVHRCDLSDPDSVRAVAEDLPVLDALVHNAGVLPPERTENADGHELTLATHVLGPHLLTALTRPARSVWMSSGGMYTQQLPIDDLEYRDGTYRGATAYARTKRMQVVLAQQWTAHGVPSHALHPGWAETPGITDSLPGFSKAIGPILRTADQGADTAVWLLAAEVAPGRFWHDRRARPTSYLPWTEPSADAARRLWDFCVETTGAP